MTDPHRFEAARIAGIAQFDIRLMSRRCAQLGAVNLGQGICDQPTPAAVKASAKAAIVNTPANPCGKVFTRGELGLVAELCCEHDALAITDEIYEYILYDGHEHVSLATLPGMAERTITISGFSKTYNMTGWRLGYAVAPEPLLARMGVVPTPLQHGVLAAFDLPASYFSTLSADYAEKRAMTMEACDSVGLTSLPPKGSYTLMVDVREAGFESDRQAADVLLERCGVGTVPGSSFYADPADGQHQLRLCFAKQHADLERACAGIRRLAEIPAG